MLIPFSFKFKPHFSILIIIITIQLKFITLNKYSFFVSKTYFNNYINIQNQILYTNINKIVFEEKKKTRKPVVIKLKYKFLFMTINKDWKKCPLLRAVKNRRKCN